MCLELESFHVPGPRPVTGKWNAVAMKSKEQSKLTPGVSEGPSLPTVAWPPAIIDIL